MGFLDNLLSKTTRKMIADVAKSAMDAVSGEFNQTFQSETSGSKGTVTARQTRTVPAEPEVPDGYDAALADADLDDKLRAVMQKEFPQYEVRANVSPETLGATGKFMPYTFGIYENGTPKLFIMGVYNNTCAERLYRWSKEEAEKAGVPMINFVYAFSNRIDYIINRLHQYL